MMRHSAIQVAAMVGLSVFAVGMAACRGDRSEKPPRQFLPDMDDSPKWRPQTASEFFADGRAMRQPVAGTVAFGDSTAFPEAADAQDASAWMKLIAEDARRSAYLKDDVGFYFGRDGRPTTKYPRGEALTTAPESAIRAWLAPGASDDAAGRAAAVRAMLARGEERYNIYCAVCHGFDGKGHGTVGERLTVPPANLHFKRFRDRRAETGSDGHIFEVIRMGLSNPDGTWKMPPYGHAVNEKDAWAVVLYVRALQEMTVGQVQPDDPDEKPSGATAPAPAGGNP